MRLLILKPAREIAPSDNADARRFFRQTWISETAAAKHTEADESGTDQRQGHWF